MSPVLFILGGQLLARHPGDGQSWAGLERVRPERMLAEFEHAGRRWYLGGQRGSGVDYFSRAMTDHFIEMAYERYRSGLEPEAFAHVGAFFCDEPEFGLGHPRACAPVRHRWQPEKDQIRCLSKLRLTIWK